MKPQLPSGDGTRDLAGQGASPRFEVFLRPGEYAVGGHQHRFHTLLGSCVSITLWHPGRRVGAMSHFLLATRSAGRPRKSNEPIDGRYGDEALTLMLQGLQSLGIDGTQCRAKIFGGGDMFPALSSAGADGVGRRNGEAARVMLEDRGIAVASESLFGIGHRKIIFDVGSGDVWEKQADQPSSGGARS